MGLSAEKRGKTWRYIFDGAKEGGNRKRYSKGGFETKADALKAGAIALSEYESAGIVINETEMSYMDFLEVWLKEYCKINLKDTTVKGYEKKIRNYINPKLGHYKLKNITPQILQQFINDLFNDGFSRNTMISIKGILTASFKYAVAPMQLIKSSPMIYVKLPLTRAIPNTPTRSKQRIAITKEDFEKIIERFPDGSSDYIPLQLGFRCGLRLSEAFALEFDDFDNTKKTITINHQVQRNSDNTGWCLVPPKYNSTRVIDLDDFTYKMLKKFIQQTNKDKSYYGDKYEHLYIDEKGNIVSEYKEGYREYNPFSRYPYGGYIQSRTMQHVARIIHSQLEMPLWDYHSLRHTHCTMLLANEVDIKYVQQRLGHKNIETTLNIYTHLTKELENKNKSKLDGILN